MNTILDHGNSTSVDKYDYPSDHTLPVSSNCLPYPFKSLLLIHNFFFLFMKNFSVLKSLSFYS